MTATREHPEHRQNRTLQELVAIRKSITENKEIIYLENTGKNRKKK